MTMAEGEHRDALMEAIRVEGEGHRGRLAGDPAPAAEGFRPAAAASRRSWELAPPRSFGRLIGMLKALVIAGDDASVAAAYVREQVGEADASPPAWYALAIAALVEGDDAVARRAADGMRSATVEPFLRTADAIDALA